MKKVSFDSLEINPTLRLNLGNIVYKKKSLKKSIRTDSIDFINKLSPFYTIKRRKPIALTEEEEAAQELIEDFFNPYDYRYSLGYFAGCHRFTFRVTFKEYKVGLKPAKFSLLLNQFRLDLDLFICLIQEILINNFPMDFYEDFFKEYVNDLDFKIHFLVVLRRRSKTQTGTKFFIIPTGCFLIYLRKQLWYTLFMDFIFIYSCYNFYKGFKKYLGLIFLLVLFYTYKLIHEKLTRVINKYKIYDTEERRYGSLGNILKLKYLSFQLYRKTDLRLLKHTFLFSHRSLNIFIDGDSFDTQDQYIELDKINSYEFILSNSMYLMDLDIEDKEL